MTTVTRKLWFLSWSERSETQRKTTIHCSYELEQPAAYAADGDEPSEKSEQDQLDSPPTARSKTLEAHPCYATVYQTLKHRNTKLAHNAYFWFKK